MEEEEYRDRGWDEEKTSEGTQENSSNSNEVRSNGASGVTHTSVEAASHGTVRQGCNNTRHLQPPNQEERRKVSMTFQSHPVMTK